MDASSSMSLIATAAVVCGIHGSTGTDPAAKESSTAHPDALDKPNSSLVVSKSEDK